MDLVEVWSCVDTSQAPFPLPSELNSDVQHFSGVGHWIAAIAAFASFVVRPAGPTGALPWSAERVLPPLDASCGSCDFLPGERADRDFRGDDTDPFWLLRLRLLLLS